MRWIEDKNDHEAYQSYVKPDGTCTACQTAKDQTEYANELGVENSKIKILVRWYLECRELEGNLYDLNFFTTQNQDALSEVSASVKTAKNAAGQVVGYDNN